MSAEIFPHTEVAAVRTHFEQYGHVGIEGLIEVSLAPPAIAEAEELALRPHPRRAGEQVSTLRRAADPKSQPALHAVLSGIEEGAALLERDITPAARREKPLIQIIRMMQDTQGPLHRDSDSLSDVVAITNLEGRSGLWFEDAEQEDGVTYTIGTGHVVFHDLKRSLLHRGFTATGDERIGLAVAKRRTGLIGG